MSLAMHYKKAWTIRSYASLLDWRDQRVVSLAQSLMMRVSNSASFPTPKSA
jgi:hypothetical protein